MVVKKAQVIQEELKEAILSHEDKKEYHSNKFQKIEDQVKSSLKSQKTDDALRDITIWALVLWSSDVHYEAFEDYVVVRFRIDWVLVDIFRLTFKDFFIFIRFLFIDLISEL